MRWLSVLLAASMLTAGVALAKEGSDDDDRGKAQAGRERGEEAREKAGEFRERSREHFLKHQDKWVLQNDDLTIWFHHGDRAKPVIAVFRTGEDGNRSGFKLQLDELFEARAIPSKPAGNASGDPEGEDDDDGDDEGDDGDGPAWKRTRGHRVNLHPAREWWTSVVNGTDEVTITMSHLFNQGNVTLVFHVPVASGPVKFDVKVDDWAWADPNNTLALRLKVLERGAERRGDNATFDGGFVAWANHATVTYPDGRAASIPVEAEVRNHGEGARVLLRFNGTGGYSALDYDPVIGVQSQSAGYAAVPGAGALLSVGVLALAAVVLGTRRRSSR